MKSSLAVASSPSLVTTYCGVAGAAGFVAFCCAGIALAGALLPGGDAAFDAGTADALFVGVVGEGVGASGLLAASLAAFVSGTDVLISPAGLVSLAVAFS